MDRTDAQALAIAHRVTSGRFGYKGYKKETMSGPSTQHILLTNQQQTILERIVRRYSSSQQLVRRTLILLLANSGLNNEQIA